MTRLRGYSIELVFNSSQEQPIFTLSRKLRTSLPPTQPGPSTTRSGPGEYTYNFLRSHNKGRVASGTVMGANAESVECKMAAGRKCSQRVKSLPNYIWYSRERQKHGRAPVFCTGFRPLSSAQHKENFFYLHCYFPCYYFTITNHVPNSDELLLVESKTKVNLLVEEVQSKQYKTQWTTGEPLACVPKMAHRKNFLGSRHSLLSNFLLLLLDQLLYVVENMRVRVRVCVCVCVCVLYIYTNIWLCRD